jgi:LmbE family N-acetylglucosaminyl deacetylase
MKHWHKTLVVAVHPDDETLGCGGTLFRLKEEFGNEIHWLIITTTQQSRILGPSFWETRKLEIRAIADMYSFDSVHELPFEAGFLEDASRFQIVSAIGKVFREVQPDTVFLPYPWDIHKEHQVSFEAALSCTKVFRNEFVERVFVMETLSETDFAPVPLVNAFTPTHFVNITGYMEKKLAAMRIFESEIKPHPFPRSEEALRALSTLRGAQGGFSEAEAFMCLKERYR